MTHHHWLTWPGKPGYGLRDLPPVVEEPGPAPNLVHVAVVFAFLRIAFDVVGLLFLPAAMDLVVGAQNRAVGLVLFGSGTIGFGVAVGIVHTVIWYGAWVPFVLMTLRGRNWARVTLVVLVCIDLPLTASNIYWVVQEFAVPAQLVATVPALALDVLVIVLLRARRAGAWFKTATAYRKARLRGVVR